METCLDPPLHLELLPLYYCYCTLMTCTRSILHVHAMHARSLYTHGDSVTHSVINVIGMPSYPPNILQYCDPLALT